MGGDDSLTRPTSGGAHPLLTLRSSLSPAEKDFNYLSAKTTIRENNSFPPPPPCASPSGHAAASAATRCPPLPAPLGLPGQCQPCKHQCPSLTGAASKGLPHVQGGTSSVFQASGVPNMLMTGTVGFSGRCCCGVLVQLPFSCLPCSWCGSHAVAGISFSPGLPSGTSPGTHVCWALRAAVS